MKARRTGISTLQAEAFPVVLNIHSMGFLNLIVALHEETEVEIPEADYPRLHILSGIAGYIA